VGTGTGIPIDGSVDFQLVGYCVVEGKVIWLAQYVRLLLCSGIFSRAKTRNDTCACIFSNPVSTQPAGVSVKSVLKTLGLLNLHLSSRALLLSQDGKSCLADAKHWKVIERIGQRKIMRILFCVNCRSCTIIRTLSILIIHGEMWRLGNFHRTLVYFLFEVFIMYIYCVICKTCTCELLLMFGLSVCKCN